MANISATWTHITSSARLQRSSQSLSVLGSQALIFGGEVVPRQPVDNQLDVVELNQKGSTSKTIPTPSAAPSPRVGAATAVLNDTLYMFSGRGGVAMAPVEENGALWSYKPEHAQWTLVEPSDSAQPFPAGRSYHAMTSNGNETLYIHAGCPEKGRLSDLWSFDTTTGAWTELPAAPPPSRGGASIAFCAGKVYRMNGFDGTCEQGGTVDVYDPETRGWSSISYEADGVAGPEARSVGALVAVRVAGKDVLVTLFGERDPSSLGHAGAGKMLGDAWAFEPESGKWTLIEPKGDVPPSRGWFDADVLHGQGGDDALVVHGGLAEDNSRLGDVWKLQFE